MYKCVINMIIRAYIINDTLNPNEDTYLVSILVSLVKMMRCNVMLFVPKLCYPCQASPFYGRLT